MPEEKSLPKPQTAFPLPEKEIPAHLASKGDAFQSRNLHLPKYLLLGAIFVVLLLVIGASVLGGKYYLNQQKLKAINDFESCAAAGFPVAESYPATCRTSDGRSFTQVLSEEEQKNLLPPEDSKTNWKTFEMSDYTIQAPPEFRKDSDAGDLETFLAITNYDVSTAPGRGFSPTLDKGKLKVEIYQSSDTTEFDSYMAQDELDPSMEKITINDLTAIKSESSDRISSVMIKNPSKNVVYSIIFYLDFANFPGIAYEILSTFKFTK